MKTTRILVCHVHYNNVYSVETPPGTGTFFQVQSVLHLCSVTFVHYNFMCFHMHPIKAIHVYTLLLQYTIAANLELQKLAPVPMSPYLRCMSFCAS